MSFTAPVKSASSWLFGHALTKPKVLGHHLDQIAFGFGLVIPLLRVLGVEGVELFGVFRWSEEELASEPVFAVVDGGS